MKTSRLRKLFLTSLVLLIACSALAADKTIKLTVKAGDHDRKNTPVCVLVDAAKSATITLPDGKKIPGQLTEPGLLNDSAKGKKELHFILPELAKGKSAELTAVLSAKRLGGGAFCWFKLPIHCIDLCYVRAGKFVSVLRYMCLPYDKENTHDTYKVFHHVYAPDGSAIITKGPGGKFTHHRGIFYGFSRTSFEGGKCDIWHCKGAHQSHEGVIAEEGGPVLGRHTVAVDWHAGDKVFANEKRELTVYNTPGGRLIEFASRLSSPGGKVKLDGDPQHAGFQFRASQKVAEGDQKNTYYLRTDGKGKPGETRNWGKGNDECANRPWNAMSFVIDGKRYTAEYIDKPTNPKEARYSERTYGRFGSYFVAEFDEDKPLEVNYRIWLQDGEMTVDQAQALRDDFVEPVEVEVK